MESSKKKNIEKTVNLPENIPTVIKKKSNVLNKNISQTENISAADPEKTILSPSQRRRLRKKKSQQNKHLISTQSLSKESETGSDLKLVGTASQHSSVSHSGTIKLNLYDKQPGHQIKKVECPLEIKSTPQKVDNSILNIEYKPPGDHIKKTESPKKIKSPLRKVDNSTSNIENKLPGDQIKKVECPKKIKSPPGKVENSISNIENLATYNTHTSLDTAQTIISKHQDLTESLKNREGATMMAHNTNKDKKVSNTSGRDETDFVSAIKIEKISNVQGLVEIDKSRDQIKAEREAKKLAKQLAKTKVKAEPNVVPNKNVQTVADNSKALPKKEIPTKSEQTDAVKKIPLTGAAVHVENVEEKQEKSKAELKAERRAIQEAQRAAKEQNQGPKKNAAPNQKIKPDTATILAPKQLSTVIQKINTKDKIRSPKKNESKINPNQRRVKLFNHLYPEREAAVPLNSDDIHPAVIRLGVQYASRIVMGSNARCIALLNVLKQVVEDYTLPANVEFSRGFEAHLAPCHAFLNSCRPLAVSMNNALKNIKSQLTQLPNNIEETDAKGKLQIAIDTYIDDQIRKAGKAITITVYNKISDGDVILTYGCSSLIENILKTAAKTKCFKVVVIEAHPWNEGKEMLRRLTAKNIKCSLVMISALSFVMREINKVVLGAGALLANGYVMARAGTALVAKVAAEYNVPVLVCCETYKFSERVQTDSIVYNEIGDPDDLITCDPLHQDSPLSNWRSFKDLIPLNLTYDVTPPDLVTAVVTELGILPCTSVPVILRIKPSEF